MQDYQQSVLDKSSKKDFKTFDYYPILTVKFQDGHLDYESGCC